MIYYNSNSFNVAAVILSFKILTRNNNILFTIICICDSVEKHVPDNDRKKKKKKFDSCLTEQSRLDVLQHGSQIVLARRLIFASIESDKLMTPSPIRS